MISVIIPARNEQKFLDQTIENLFSTAKEKIEVVFRP